MSGIAYSSSLSSCLEAGGRVDSGVSKHVPTPSDSQIRSELTSRVPGKATFTQDETGRAMCQLVGAIQTFADSFRNLVRRYGTHVVTAAGGQAQSVRLSAYLTKGLHCSPDEHLSQ